MFRLPPPEENLSFGPVDPRLAVLRLDDANGRPAALATSVGIHPVVGGRDFYAISPITPLCYARRSSPCTPRPRSSFSARRRMSVPVRRVPQGTQPHRSHAAGAAIMAAKKAQSAWRVASTWNGSGSMCLAYRPTRYWRIPKP